jgi:2-polyprenyl-3-methyl-5-hydroxy-6-metoxy-1,4-benzoquinol methylase
VTGLLSQTRRRGIEILDDPDVDPAVMQRAMRDVERANIVFGGRRAAIAELTPALSNTRGSALLLDVGTGRGDIPAEAKRVAQSNGLTLRTIGLDMSAPLVSSQCHGTDWIIRGNALSLPLRDSSVDIVLASQILHHFPEDDAVAFVRELNRVARSRVVISDLRRSLIAAAGFWLGSFPLRFHPVTRHDGVVSVMRGFIPSELASIVERATGQRPIVTRRLGFRLTTSWTPR